MCRMIERIADDDRKPGYPMTLDMWTAKEAGLEQRPVLALGRSGRDQLLLAVDRHGLSQRGRSTRRATCGFPNTKPPSTVLGIAGPFSIVFPVSRADPRRSCCAASSRRRIV